MSRDGHERRFINRGLTCWLVFAEMSDANADEATRCLEIARGALQAGQYEKAGRFGEKAMKLYPNDEVNFRKV